jgi:hypothetical protein
MVLLEVSILQCFAVGKFLNICPGSHESYVRNILAPACTPIDQGGLGYRGVVLNFRGCMSSYTVSPAKLLVYSLQVQEHP